MKFFGMTISANQAMVWDMIRRYFTKNETSSARNFKNCDENGLLDNINGQIDWQKVWNVVRR